MELPDPEQRVISNQADTPANLRGETALERQKKDGLLMQLIQK